MKVNKQDALKYFNNGEKRILEVDHGAKWFIIPFVEFQYGKLNPGNRVHNSVLLTLNKYNIPKIIKGLISPLEGAKDKDKDKDKDKEEDKEGESTSYHESLDEFLNKEPEKQDFSFLDKYADT